MIELDDWRVSETINKDVKYNKALSKRAQLYNKLPRLLLIDDKRLKKDKAKTESIYMDNMVHLFPL